MIRHSKVLLPAVALLSVVVFARSYSAPAHTPIFTIQGSADTSPLKGLTVTTEGIVTGDFQGREQLNGFYLQDAAGDGNPATSDGVFVYVNVRNELANVDVKPGDRVVVSGRVSEFKGQTQIERVTQLRVVEQAPLPAAVKVRLPWNEGTLEPLEGMLITFPQALTVSGNDKLGRYGELLLSAEGRLWVPTNAADSPALDTRARNATRRLILDDGSTSTPRPVPFLDTNGTRRAGDRVQGLTGVLAYAFDDYRLLPTQPPAFETLNARPPKPAPVGGALRIASFNVHNYFTTLKSQDSKARGAETAEEFARQSAKVVAALRGLDADIVGLIEMENNGPISLRDLVTKLNAAYGEKKDAPYDFVREPSGGMGTDAIKVAFLYKPERVELVGVAHSDANPLFDRPPLAQTFRARQERLLSFTAIINHFKSKGGCPTEGDVDTGQGCWNQRRTQQATALLALIERLKTQQKENDVLAIGDLNAYDAEDPLHALREGGLISLDLRLPKDERYSYVFDAQSGSLDHALATPSLVERITGITKWHINADEPAFLQIGERGAPPLRPNDRFDPLPFRSSDHDPILMGISAEPRHVAQRPAGSPAH